MLNELSSYKIENEDDKFFLHSGLSILLRLLAPITPHITHHLWQQLGFEKIIIDAPWPKIDKSALKTDEVEFIVQINGKLRGSFKTSVDASEDDLIELARENVSSFLADKAIKKSIIVNHRHLINLVVSE